MLECPNCGSRDVSEFRFGGEAGRRPAGDPDLKNWARYIHFRKNVAGEQVEWWYHRLGCRKWFQARRDTRSNEVKRTWMFTEAQPARSEATTS